MQNFIVQSYPNYKGERREKTIAADSRQQAAQKANVGDFRADLSHTWLAAGKRA